MDAANLWYELSYLDGILFTIWVGIIYIGKKAIDKNDITFKNCVKKS